MFMWDRGNVLLHRAIVGQTRVGGSRYQCCSLLQSFWKGFCHDSPIRISYHVRTSDIGKVVPHMKYLAPINQNGPLLTAMDNSGNLQTFNMIGYNNAYGSDFGRTHAFDSTNADQGRAHFQNGCSGNPAEWDALPGDRAAHF